MNPNVEKILKLPAWQRGLILLAVVVLVVAGFFWGLYLPAMDELTARQEQNRTLDAKLVEDRSIASNLPKFKEEYEKMQEQLASALQELPNDKEIPTLLTSIAGLAKESGLDVLRFQPMPERPKGFYAEVPVTLRLVGTFHQFAEFSFSVGEMPRIVNIGNIKLGGPRQKSGATELSIDCLATTFRFVDSSSGK